MPRRIPHALDETAPPAPLGRLFARLTALGWSHKRAAGPALAATSTAQVAALACAVAQGFAIDYIAYHAPRDTDADVPADPFAGLPAALVPPADWAPQTTVTILAAIILVLGLAVGATRYWQRVADERFAQRCLVDLRTRLYARLQALSFDFFDAGDTGQIINRITADVQSVRMFIQGVMIRMLTASVAAVAFVAYLATQNLTLTLIALATFPLQGVAMARYGKVTKPKFKRHAELNDTLIHKFQEAIAGVRVVRSFGAERPALDRLNDASSDVQHDRIRLAKDQAKALPVPMASSMLAGALLLGFGAAFVLRSKADPAAPPFTLGDLWVFFALTRQLAGQLDAIVMVVAQAPEALAGADRVFKLVDEEPTIAEPNAPAALPPGHPGAVRFDNVSFAYEDEPVLSNISFAAEPGQTVAIVGPTGSGKSTLLALLSRFYDPTEGTVTVGGVPLTEVPIRELRARIAAVFQEPFLFSNTVASNVAFGQHGATDADRARSLADADALEFVDQLDEGEQTVIGERGVSLSGGQRQRLTLARALLTDPDILVLDDATGAVDPLTEARIQETLDRRDTDRAHPRTTFIVAHRLSTLRKADTILVLERGRLVAQGTHDELMNTPGHYKTAARIQLALDESADHDTPDGGAP